MQQATLFVTCALIAARESVHRVQVLVRDRRLALLRGAVVRRVALDRVAGVREALPVGPRAVEALVAALHDAVRDDEPCELEAVLLGLLEPPVVVGAAVVVDRD